MTSTERWPTLPKYCAGLRGRIAVESIYTSPLSSSSVSIAQCWTLRVSIFRSDLRWQRQALELLALVASVDINSFKFLLQEECGAYIPPFDDANVEGTSPDQLQIRYVLRMKGDLSLRGFRSEFYDSVNQMPESVAYQVVVDKVKELAGSTYVFPLVIPICLSVPFPNRADILSLYRIQSTTRPEEILQGTAAVVLRPGALCVSLKAFYSVMQQSVYNSLAQLLASPLPLTSAKIPFEPPLPADDLITREEFTQILCKLFLRPSSPCSCTNDTNSVVSKGNMIPFRQFTALCAVASMATNVHSLHLFEAFVADDLVSERKWPWLVYALFMQKRSSIRHLSLCLDEISGVDRHTVAHMVASVNPLACLLGAGERSDWYQAQVISTQGLQIATNFPSDPMSWEDIELDLPCNIADVCDSHDDVVNIVLPGLGHCRCPRFNLRRVETTENEELKGVVSLEINSTSTEQDRRDAIHDLLSPVGSSLELLKVASSSPCFLHLSDILADCPKLQKLHLERIALHPFDQLEYLQDDTCRLQSLVLDTTALPFQLATHLFQLLSCTDSGIGSSLQELRLLKMMSEDFQNMYVLNALVTALNENRTLRRIEVTLDASCYSIFHERLIQHDGEYLPVVKKHLSEDAKQAFVDAVRTKLGETLLLDYVLEFAAEPMQRKVCVFSTEFHLEHDHELYSDSSEEEEIEIEHLIDHNGE